MGLLVPTSTAVTREGGDNPPPAAMLSMHFGGPVATILLARAEQEPPLPQWAAPRLGWPQCFSSAPVRHRAVVLGGRGSGSAL